MVTAASNGSLKFFDFSGPVVDATVVGMASASIALDADSDAVTAGDTCAGSSIASRSVDQLLGCSFDREVDAFATLRLRSASLAIDAMIDSNALSF